MQRLLNRRPDNGLHPQEPKPRRHHLLRHRRPPPPRHPRLHHPLLWSFPPASPCSAHPTYAAASGVGESPWFQRTASGPLDEWWEQCWASCARIRRATTMGSAAQCAVCLMLLLLRGGSEDGAYPNMLTFPHSYTHLHFLLPTLQDPSTPPLGPTGPGSTTGRDGVSSRHTYIKQICIIGVQASSSITRS